MSFKREAIENKNVLNQLLQLQIQHNKFNTIVVACNSNVTYSTGGMMIRRNLWLTIVITVTNEIHFSFKVILIVSKFISGM